MAWAVLLSGVALLCLYKPSQTCEGRLYMRWVERGGVGAVGRLGLCCAGHKGK